MACKFNDPKTFSLGNTFLNDLATSIQKTLGISTKDLLQYEFEVFRKLSFSLLVDVQEIAPHVERLKQQIEVRQTSQMDEKSSMNSLTQ